MSTPVPVPSKAAIRALRGLVLGTTCTLALVAEDRRRRINAAQRALSNGQKLKSFAGYRPGGAEDVIAAKEERASIPESLLCDYRSPHGPGSDRQPGHGKVVGTSGCDVPVDTWALDVFVAPPPERPKAAQQKGLLPTTPRPLRPTFGRNPLTAAAKKHPVRTPHRCNMERGTASLVTVAAEITALCSTGKPERLGDAAALLQRTVELPRAKSGPGLDDLLRSTALLSQTCQSAGRMDDALKVLRAVLGLGEIDEDVYFTHDPLPIVDDTLRRDRHGITPSRRYKLAVDLFMPDLRGDARLNGTQMLRMAEKLIEAGIDTGRHTLVKKLLFERLTWYLGEPEGCDVLRRVFQLMYDKSMFEAVVRFFLSCGQYHQHLMSNLDEYYGVCDLVVKCTAEANGYRVAEVLRRMHLGRPTGAKMRVSWVSQLLYLHWQKHGSYGETLKLFHTLREAGISSLVCYLDGAYRPMIQIALEAGKESAAKELFEELVKLNPASREDARILGLFALARAKAGDWDAVEQFFRETYSAPGVVSERVSDIVVPILKVFRASHTLEETENFLKFALEDLGVHLSKYMVTLVANEYGAARDVKSFLAWLRYCSEADFEMDAAFSNAVLANCRNRWNFRFMDLMRVYRALRKLGGAFSDGVTDNIMTGAALASPPSYRKVSLALALGSRSTPRKAVPRGRYDPASVSTSMALSIEVGRPDKAIRMYRFMTASGMPHCPECLRLYSIASMKLGVDKLDDVLQTLQAVKKSGVDIGDAITALFVADLDSVDRSLGGRHVERHVRNVLRGMRRYGLSISSLLLNKAAATLAKAGDYEGAVGLALMAARTRGEAPGYNVTNFNILLDIYVANRQWKQLSTLVETTTQFGWWARMAGRHFKLLKRLKFLWLKELSRPGHEDAALTHLETAIRNLTAHREKLREEQVAVEKGVSDILAAVTAVPGYNAREIGRGETESPAALAGLG